MTFNLEYHKQLHCHRDGRKLFLNVFIVFQFVLPNVFVKNLIVMLDERTCSLLFGGKKTRHVVCLEITPIRVGINTRDNKNCLKECGHDIW